MYLALTWLRLQLGLYERTQLKRDEQFSVKYVCNWFVLLASICPSFGCVALNKIINICIDQIFRPDNAFSSLMARLIFFHLQNCV